MPSEDILKSCNSKMKKAFDIFNQDLASLRTGRANSSMLDIIKVEVYGQNMSINQIASLVKAVVEKKFPAKRITIEKVPTDDNRSYHINHLQFFPLSSA